MYEAVAVALAHHGVLELRHAVEAVLERVLVSAGHHEHVAQSRDVGLHDVLDGLSTTGSIGLVAGNA